MWFYLGLAWLTFNEPFRIDNNKHDSQKKKKKKKEKKEKEKERIGNTPSKVFVCFFFLF